MKIQGGYGKKAIEANIKEYIELGHDEQKARAMALNMARKFFQRRNPKAEIPEYLKD